MQNTWNFKTYSLKINKEQEAHGPQLSHLSEIATADVMQDFFDPFIASNERIIIWAVLGFEEKKTCFFFFFSFCTIYRHDSQWSIWTNS